MIMVGIAAFLPGSTGCESSSSPLEGMKGEIAYKKTALREQDVVEKLKAMELLSYPAGSYFTLKML
jgi:hypothetical protein